MTKNNKLVAEENKLIAEFMGNPTIFNPIHDATLYQVKEQGNMTYHIDEFQYHTSWDWLIPVIENIDHLQHEPVMSIEKALSTRSIDDTYKAVVEFIKEHNN